ncbi:MAG: exodeoxyribonuclease VII small subunit [Fuerstiella sp.]|nr:exodeoxyribonuclease VII small subunit [Fuerstiella sp.]MCP4858006.1 exodeoxyribonuclease VII small subunit [Fuerstiella sp.]
MAKGKGGKKKKTEAEPPIEASMDELQEIVQVLESGQEPLEVALQKFERGMGLLGQCHRQLDDAAQRIEILTRIGADGAIETAPFDATTTLSRQQNFDSDADDEEAGEDDDVEPSSLF